MRKLTTSDNCVYLINPENEKDFETIKKHCIDNKLDLFENEEKIELKKKNSKED